MVFNCQVLINYLLEDWFNNAYSYTDSIILSDWRITLFLAKTPMIPGEKECGVVSEKNVLKVNRKCDTQRLFWDALFVG